MTSTSQRWTGGVPGFCEGRPDGAFIFNIPGVGVRTDHGMLSLPGRNTSASYCRIGYGDTRPIVCQGQEDDTAWLWSGAWVSLHLPAFGPNACIFDRQNVPHVISTPPPVGYRNVAADGRLVTCEETYANPPLYEYTDYGDIAIGQGGKDINQGAIVRFADDGVVRRFADGVLRNIRVRRNGNAFAVAMCNYPTQTATITWCTIAELRALPPAR